MENYEAIVVCPSYLEKEKWDVVCWIDNIDKCFDSIHKKQSDAIVEGKWQLENSTAKYLTIYNKHGQVIEVIHK
tara:strand:+ start:207 stop:428 length:222 start_codon:yes stop_codon:yes gene_type:complete